MSQVSTQAPVPHPPVALVVSQTAPQAPQFAGSVLGTSQPVDESRSQSRNPASHTKAHLRPRQLGIVFGREHVLEHRPQVAMSSSEASQPFAGSPSQSSHPSSQRKPHPPAMHSRTAWGRSGHATPQPEQLSTSVSVSMQLVPQRVVPTVQSATQVLRVALA